MSFDARPNKKAGQHMVDVDGNDEDGCWYVVSVDNE